MELGREIPSFVVDASLPTYQKCLITQVLLLGVSWRPTRLLTIELNRPSAGSPDAPLVYSSDRLKQLVARAGFIEVLGTAPINSTALPMCWRRRRRSPSRQWNRDSLI